MISQCILSCIRHPHMVSLRTVFPVFHFYSSIFFRYLFAAFFCLPFGYRHIYFIPKSIRLNWMGRMSVPMAFRFIGFCCICDIFLFNLCYRLRTNSREKNVQKINGSSATVAIHEVRTRYITTYKSHD